MLFRYVRRTVPRLSSSTGDSRQRKGTIKKLQIAAIEHNRAVVARFRARIVGDKGSENSDLRGKPPFVCSRVVIVTTRSHTGDPYSSYLESSTQELQKLQDS